MQQDNNHMEDNFRQLENQQLPDLSNMDKHWQHMEQMLRTDGKSKPIKKKTFFNLYKKRFFLAAAIITLVIAAWLYKNAHTAAADIQAPSIVKNLPVSEKTKSSIPGNQNIPVTNNVQQNLSSTVNKNRHEVPPVANKLVAVDTTAIVKANPSSENPDENLSIADFYQRIQKPVQEFTINAEKGGMITCKEGTAFNILPSAFKDENGKIISGTVKIFVEEFYKYSDMVAANLTTTSAGKQLFTGGMVRITATAGGNNLELRTDKGINLSMPTTTYDPEMRLFTSENEPAINDLARFAGYSVQERNINWNLTGQQSIFPAYDGKTNVPNNLDQPYNVVKTPNKRIGKFALSKNSSLSTDQMKKILEEKFGNFYDVIKVKEETDPGRSANFFYRGTVEKDNVIGDSSRMTLEQGLRLKYIDKRDIGLYTERIKADSIAFIKRFIASKFFNDASPDPRINLKDGYQLVYNDTKDLSPDALDKIYDEYIRNEKNYSFTVKKLGWINCDKNANCSNKTNFVINLPADVQAENFVSQAVFIRTRSVMPGRTINNQIGFQNLPADMGVYIVGIGKRNGKVVSFMQKLKVGKTEVNINDLNETTPEAFRKKIAELDIN